MPANLNPGVNAASALVTWVAGVMTVVQNNGFAIIFDNSASATGEVLLVTDGSTDDYTEELSNLQVDARQSAAPSAADDYDVAAVTVLNASAGPPVDSNGRRIIRINGYAAKDPITRKKVDFYINLTNLAPAAAI